MSSRTRRLGFFLACLIFSTISVAIANDGEVEEEFEFNYGSDSEEGPHHWGRLNSHWNACGKGKLQSPIDLDEDRMVVSPKLRELRRTYKPAQAHVKNRGHDIMVEWEGDAGGVMINSTKYKLLQCHWHTPSEHTVKGKRFKMEIHLVHENADKHFSVIGILYKLGRPDPFLKKLLHHIKPIKHEVMIDGGHHQGVDIGVVDPWEIKFGSRKYFRYIGSLTVPPCTEGVMWTILKKVRTVSREQIRALRDAVHDGFMNNARPTQTLNKINVYRYRPES